MNDADETGNCLILTDCNVVVRHLLGIRMGDAVPSGRLSGCDTIPSRFTVGLV